jgi:preprotein translocase subunit SecE
MLNPVSYIKEVVGELKKVTWPNKQQTTNMTILVVVISTIVAIYLTGVDFALNKLITGLINK